MATARGRSTIRSASAATTLALLVGACAYDFGKFAPSGADGGSSLDSAGGGDGPVSAESGSPPIEGGSDGDGAILADTAIDDVATESAPDTGLAVYDVSGTISGLVGNGLRLTNAGNGLSIASGATAFTFPPQTSGSAYGVTVTTQPTAPTQTCAVTNGSGTIAGANVTNVSVVCTPTCAPGCNDGQTCVDGSDCASGSCQGGKCTPPACAPACPDGNACSANGECGSGSCTGNKCQPPGCSPGCNDGHGCGANADCASQVCTAAKCQPPACAPNCLAGSPCGANGDCKSGTCRGNHTCK